jgi:flavin reductase (DIM6/NTAB) family NADH-FMN oxidoreductase RutF
MTISLQATAAGARPGFDKRAYRQALGEFVTGVTIVTTLDATGTPAGLTANSFNSVSLDPPMVLWSLALDSTNLAAFRQARWWAVHVLHAGQQDLSNQFASRRGNRFDGVATVPGPGGIPLLPDFSARFVCRAAFEYEGGDHAIFLGEVEQFEQAALTPLVYHKGRYGGVFPAAEPPAEAPSLAALEALGLVAFTGDVPSLTPAGRDVADGLLALAGAAPGSLTPHEVAALRHLLPRL